MLSAGTLNTPSILMHSGIGPASQLQQYSIPVVHTLSAVGQNLHDHPNTLVMHTRDANSIDHAEFYGDKQAMDDALEQWKGDRTGPWTKFGCQLVMGMYKLDRLLASKEFRELPADRQSYLLNDTVPHYETVTGAPVHLVVPDFPQDNLNYAAFLLFINPQGLGEATLQSSDPNVPLRFDPKFLSHPFDRRLAIESLRDLLRVIKHDEYAKNTLSDIIVPKSDSDEDLLEFWKGTVGSTWHMTGTAKMGKSEDDNAAVDNNFKIFGIDNLRVADLSVVPVLPTCHTQAMAYVTGATCADKLIEHYNLE